MDGEERLLAEGEFKFVVPLAKAVDQDGNTPEPDYDGPWFIEGVASDTLVDREGEKISAKGQQSMVQWAKSGKVVLGGEANHWQVAFDDDLGAVVDGHVDDQTRFHIRSELDKGNVRARTLWNALTKKKKQLGLSVFGKVTDHSYDDGAPSLDEIELSRVTVTPNPVNPRTWLEAVAKSLPAPEDVEKRIKKVSSWRGAASDYASTEAYCRACLIDVNAAAGRTEKAQSHCMLPVRGPGDGSGTFVDRAVFAAAGGRGIRRVKKPADVPAEAWSKAVKAAANKIIRAYGQMDRTAPVGIYRLAGREPPEAAKSWWEEELDGLAEALRGYEAGEDEAEAAKAQALDVLSGLLAEMKGEETSRPEPEPLRTEVETMDADETTAGPGDAAKSFGEVAARLLVEEQPEETVTTTATVAAEPEPEPEPEAVVEKAETAGSAEEAEAPPAWAKELTSAFKDVAGVLERALEGANVSATSQVEAGDSPAQARKSKTPEELEQLAKASRVVEQQQTFGDVLRSMHAYPLWTEQRPEAGRPEPEQ